MSDPLSIATGLITLLQLTAKATEYLKDVKDGGSERTKLRDELRSLTYILQMIHDRVEEQEDTENSEGLKPEAIASLVGPEGPLERLETTMVDIVAKLVPKTGIRRVAMRLKWPFDKKEVLEHFETIERLKSHFSLVLENDLITLSKFTNTKVGEIGKQVEDLDAARRTEEEEKKRQETDRIFSWISTTSYHDKQTDVFQSVQPGTGQWFLESAQYLEWAFTDRTNLLWCSGLPGAGKTRIASIVIDMLERICASPSMPVVYIYCDHNQRESQTALKLVSSLLEQILRRRFDSSLPPEVSAFYAKHNQKGTQPKIKEVCDVFKQVCSQCDLVYIVIDALDECSSSDELALEFITTLRELADGMRVDLLITSRSSTTFEEYFVEASHIDIAAHDKDIRMYLEAQVPKKPRLAKHIRVDADLQEDMIETIMHRSQGMFLLTALYLDSLSRKITRKDVRTSLATLPKTLDATYEQALARIRSQEEDDVELAETVLSWVLCARRPLSVAELQHMYAVRQLTEDEDDTEPVLLDEEDLPLGDILTAVCGDLIVVDAASKVVRVVHYTAQDYLLRAYEDSLHERRLELTKVSLSYLQLHNFAAGPCNSAEEMAERLKGFPFLEYAARFWGSEIDEARLEVLWAHLERFLSNQSSVSISSQIWSLSQDGHTVWNQDYPTDVPALVLVASFELPAVLERLVIQGSDIEGSGSDGETALMRSVRCGHGANVKVLLQQGASFPIFPIASVAGKATTGLEGWSLLMSAVTSGSVDTVRALVEAGADIGAQTAAGESALSLATANGEEAVANLLADAGATLPPTEAGKQAAMEADRRGLDALVGRLSLVPQDDYGVAVPKEVMDFFEVRKRLEFDMLTLESEITAFTDVDSFLRTKLEGLPYDREFHGSYILEASHQRLQFAELFQCTKRTTNARYTVKVFSFMANVSSYEDRCEVLNKADNIRAEVMSLRKLRHPHITELVDVFVSNDMREIHLVEELVMFDFIVMSEKLPESSTRVIFRQLLSALAYMHGEGWAHRDIKPESITIDSESLRIKLNNFGLAINLRELPGEVDSTLCGTSAYVAPEILSPKEHRRYSYNVDVWSAGVVLYACLCGFLPFSDELYSQDFPHTLSDQIKSGRFDYPSPQWDDVGHSALHLIDSMLVVNPERRLSAEQCLNHDWMMASSEA